MKTKEEIDELYHELWDEFINKYDDNLHYYSFVEGYTQCHEDNNTSKVTRVEVVDKTGKVYSKWDCNVELSYQDNGRTLKVFVK